jgi:spermidine synthase
VIGVLAAACMKRPHRFAFALALVVLGVNGFVQRTDLLHAERTFFGVHRVTTDAAAGRRRLFHGSTLHGEQSLDEARRLEPLTYFSRTGPIGQTFDRLSARLQRVAVVGLGAGSLAAYAGTGQHFTFYEIDPAVERIAREREFFTYLADCGDRCEVVLGDARLSLGRDATLYDMIVLDAFSSDAIPAHLITREAVNLYLSKLASDGVIAFHISNRFLDLRPLIGALMAERGLPARVQRHYGEVASGTASSMWVIAARTTEALGPIATDSRWQPLSAGAVRIWTDDYSDILSVLGRP